MALTGTTGQGQEPLQPNTDTSRDRRTKEGHGVSEHTDDHRSERGAAAIEYALLASLIAIAILTGASAIGCPPGRDLQRGGQCVLTDSTDRTGDRERGAVAVEFAFLLPLLVVILFGIIQFGITFNRQQGIHAAAREGARLGSLPGTTTAQIESPGHGCPRRRAPRRRLRPSPSPRRPLAPAPPASAPTPSSSRSSATTNLDIPLWGTLTRRPREHRRVPMRALIDDGVLESERGAVAITVALSLVVLMGAAAIAVDLGLRLVATTQHGDRHRRRRPRCRARLRLRRGRLPGTAADYLDATIRPPSSTDCSAEGASEFGYVTVDAFTDVDYFFARVLGHNRRHGRVQHQRQVGHPVRRHRGPAPVRLVRRPSRRAVPRRLARRARPVAQQ